MEININSAFYDSIRQVILLSMNDSNETKSNFINLIENKKVYCDNLLSSENTNLKEKLKRNEILKIKNSKEIVNVKMKINVGNHVIGKICKNLENVSIYNKDDYILFTTNKIL